MIIEKKTDFSIFTSDENVFEDFFNSFLTEEKNYEEAHLIIHILNTIKTTSKDILQFLEFAKNRKENNTSFVIVNTAVDVDDFPEELNIVPTLQEAVDIIEMENIERELGF
ncbi:hypothetical protein [uncultured Polaribacter sp.]|uniref:hypothetical protein n=1 Tax=uncultured Polaribacter sp. TaxID=174711 RepID=UPI00262B54C0|nr:hypothetical protein [uncultured Polaribacter sp.]